MRLLQVVRISGRKSEEGLKDRPEIYGNFTNRCRSTQIQGLPLLRTVSRSGRKDRNAGKIAKQNTDALCILMTANEVLFAFILQVLTVGNLYPPQVHYSYVISRPSEAKYKWKTIAEKWSYCNKSCQGNFYRQIARSLIRSHMPHFRPM